MIEIWVSIISGVLTLVGVIITNSASNRQIEHKLEVSQAITDTKLENLTQEVRRHTDFAMKIPVIESRLDNCESDIKEQFLSLLQNFNFVVIKNNCPEFQDYCFILLKTRILKYENNILQATEKNSWGSYYSGSFIHDKNLELQKHINQISSYFMKLFDLKKNKDLNDKESYSPTYNGYKNLSKDTIVPRLTELKISRKAGSL